MPDTKEIERRVIEWARQNSTLIPSGELQEFERPDWRIPSASIAIEVSLLLPGKSDGALFSPPQLSKFQEQVVTIAEQTYRELRGPGPVDVLVYFVNDWGQKRDPKAMGLALAQFVLSNYPSDALSVTLDETTPDGFAVIRIERIDGGWGTGSLNSIQVLTYEQLRARIEGKNRHVPEYRARIPQGWQVWLLFGTSPSVLWTVSTPHEVTAWRFACGFDRVLLHSWEHGVLQLNTVKDEVEIL